MERIPVLGICLSTYLQDLLQVSRSPACPGSCNAAQLPGAEGTQAGYTLGNPLLWCPLYLAQLPAPRWWPVSGICLTAGFPAGPGLPG